MLHSTHSCRAPFDDTKLVLWVRTHAPHGPTTQPRRAHWLSEHTGAACHPSVRAMCTSTYCIDCTETAFPAAALQQRFWNRVPRITPFIASEPYRVSLSQWVRCNRARFRLRGALRCCGACAVRAPVLRAACTGVAGCARLQGCYAPSKGSAAPMKLHRNSRFGAGP